MHSHAGANSGDKRVLWAVAANFLLTFAQIVGGILSGSLSLIADALHNFSDAASLVIAFAARRIARRPSDEIMTFGYVRAEIVAALINYTTLIIIGIYLLYEAVMRFIEPQPIEGWLVVMVAGIALLVDVVTAFLTYALSKESMNIRAAFVHNVADALGSLGVIAAGTLILLYQWDWVDPLVTLMIAAYVLWQAYSEIGGSIRLLMLGSPPGLDIKALVNTLRHMEGVDDVHHVHVWAIDEQQNAVEAHIVTKTAGSRSETIKEQIKIALKEQYGIGHSTLEFEQAGATCERESVKVIGHDVEAAHGGKEQTGNRHI
ncbi:MAG: cation diffusion facilitator family transporter [Pseudomonadota bacterium]|nr:cation diffusion facilitator family transporter [Pseudomonadota bacterium]